MVTSVRREVNAIEANGKEGGGGREGERERERKGKGERECKSSSAATMLKPSHQVCALGREVGSPSFLMQNF